MMDETPAKDCRTCRYDVPLEERQRIGPGAPLCRHPEAETPGFWGWNIDQCYTPKDGAP